MAAPQSPNLMSFDDEPAIVTPAAPASASSVDSVESPSSSSFSLATPASPVEIPPSDATESERAVLHFFVSCRGVDGNSLVSPARSAHTLVRGAFNMLSSATTMANTKSPRAKPPTEVNVEVRVARETPIFGFGSDIPVQNPPPAPTSGGLTVEMDSFGELGTRFSDKAPPPTDGLLDSESYWSERHKSRNPRFSVGFSVRCKSPAEFDRHVQIMVMIPDEGTLSNRNSQVFGYALTSFQEMFTVATSGNYKQKMTLPVHSTVLDGATVELQFANIQPQQHPLFKAQHNLFRSFLFYPLMKEEHAEMQAANAKLAVEEAAEVDFSVKIPLQLLRVCQYELLQMYDEWKLRYNYTRKKNRYFDNDAEALNFGHDVFRVQVVCGRALKIRSRANAASAAVVTSDETEMTTDLDVRSSRTSGFSMGSMVGGRGGFVNRIKAGKWGGSSGSSSFGSNDPDAAEVGAETTGSNSVHPFVVVKFDDGVVGNREYTVGKTNTEYDSPNPVWSSNMNASTKCPHGKPNTKFHASRVLRSRVVMSPVNALKQFVFYRPSVQGSTDQQLPGWLRFQVFNEHYGYMSGIENDLIGEVMVPLQSIRDAMTIEEKTVFDDDDGTEVNASRDHEVKPRQIVTSLTLVDWFDVRSPSTDEIFGQIQLRINILLANPLAPLGDDDLLADHTPEPSPALPRRYRRTADCSPFPGDGVVEGEIPLNFLYPHVLNIRKQVTEVTDMIRLTEHLVEEKKTFKSSLHKKRADIQGIPTNLHVSYFRIFRHFGSQTLPQAPIDAHASTEDLLGLGDGDAHFGAAIYHESLSIQERMMIPETHATVTCGAPTAHAMGLSDCGLREMELEMHNFQSVLEKSSPRLIVSPVSPASDSNCFIPEDSSDFFYPPLDDENEVDAEDDDIRSTDSGFSSDAATSNNPGSPTATTSTAPAEPAPKKKTSKYSVMARKAAAARAKAMSNKRFIKKKSSRQLDQKNSDEKAAVYAKYPSFRTEPEEGVDPTTSVNYAVRILCRLEMLRTEYYLRKSVAVSQSVSSLVTCFMAELDLCLQERNDKVLDQMARVGFLIGWESLISSHGKELYMISDAWVAIKCLETFSFKICESTDMEVVVEKNEGVGYIIKVPVPPAQFAVLPETLRFGGLISVTAVLFTQGINEMQSLANMVGHSGVSIQRKINSTSFRTISEYYNRFTETCGIGMSEVSVGSHPDEILRNLRVSVESENSASKNTCILLHAADAVRSLNGGRVTYCKSGKDRTAMSTTLEQARLLVQRKRHVLQEIESGSATEYGPLEEVKDVANTMREFGVRIHVAKKNVGRFKYSFNSLQRKLLPEIYRPPMSTIQDMVTSVTARDS